MIESLISQINFVNLGIVFAWVVGASFGVPGALIVMVSSGALANNYFDLGMVVLTASIAAMLGDIGAYELARGFSGKLSSQLQRFSFFRTNEGESRCLLEKSQFWFVFFTRFALTQLCAIVSYISGLAKLDRKRFVSAVVLGEFLYGLIYPMIGFIFKQTWNDVASVIGNVLAISALIVLLLALLVAFWYYRQKA